MISGDLGSRSIIDFQFAIPRDDSVCAKFEQLLNESDVREASNSAARNSGVHVNIESYRCGEF